MNMNSRGTPGGKIVILGAGFAGLAALKKISGGLKGTAGVEITLIDRNNYFVFAPLLHQVAVGVLHPWDIIAPLRRLNLGRRTSFVQAVVESIDLGARAVVTSAGRFAYDYLVIALGSAVGPGDVPGLDDHPNVYNLKELDDASDIKNHLYTMFEQASLEPDPAARREMLTFCIAGAGYTGTEFAAALADAVFHYAARTYRKIDPAEIAVHVIEIEDRLIDDLPPEWSAYIARRLERGRITLHYHTRVTAVADGWVELNGAEKIPCRTLVRVTGVVASPVAAGVASPRDETGRLLVDDYLGLSGHPGVYVAGDCAHYRDAATGAVAQARAHHAVRQAKIAGGNVAAEAGGKPRRKYVYADKMLIISLGRSSALLKFYRLWVHGWPALLVWVAAYSLLVTGVKNRFKIAGDWLLSRLYGPDMAVTLPFRLSTRRKGRGGR
jgi:NADH dehydrogenase